jgi:D-xylose transport system ATP-binding protein
MTGNENGSAAAGVVVQGVSKHFGHVAALSDASMEIPFGQVTALVGDNGAGKSTLAKVLSGVVLPDQGQITVSGNAVFLDSPNAARRQGIHTVYQDLALADNLDVVENLFLGQERRKKIFGVTVPWLDRSSMDETTLDLLSSLGITTIRSINQQIELLSGGQRQTVAIARAVREEAALVILDEPTAALGVRQSAHVMDAIGRLRQQGTGILLVSHNLYEVFAVSDRIAVMRLGRVTKVFQTDSIDEQTVVAAIMGAGESDPHAGRASPDAQAGPGASDPTTGASHELPK